MVGKFCISEVFLPEPAFYRHYASVHFVAWFWQPPLLSQEKVDERGNHKVLVLRSMNKSPVCQYMFD